MRVTGGLYKGRVLQCPPGIIRPAMDRMRESLFSILQSRWGSLEDLSFLDIFSGSGMVAVEAASRGCTRVDCVEMDRGKAPVIRQNLDILPEIWQLHLREASAFLKYVTRQEGQGSLGPWNLVYLDPPFPLKRKERFLEGAGHPTVLAPGGELMIHYPGEDRLPEILEIPLDAKKAPGSPEAPQGPLRRLVRKDLRTFGRSHLAFYWEESSQ